MERVAIICAAIAIALVIQQILPIDETWGGGKSAPDVSPHLQRPLDIPLERLDRPQRLPALLNLNRASPHQLKSLPGLNEAQVEKISQGRPYQYIDELVTRQILSQDAYDRIKDLITVE